MLGLRVTITQNTIASNGYLFGTAENLKNTLSHGIYMSGSYFKVTNNIIHSNNGFGMQVAGGYDPSLHAGIQFANATNWLIANNTFAFQRNGSGIVLYRPGTQNNTILNNLFYDKSTHAPTTPNGVNFYSAGTGNVLINNLFYSPKNRVAIGTTKYNATLTYKLPSSNLVQVNPKLINAPGFNFRLTSGSAAINKGLKDSRIPVDFDRRSRPQGVSHDIGAFEFVSGGTSALAVPVAPSTLRIS